MEITTRTVQDVLHITVRGRLDTATAPALTQQCAELPQSNDVLRVALDASGITYISSAGIRSILKLGEHLKASGRTLAVCGLTGMARSVFSMTGLDAIIPIHESLDAMLKKAP